MTKKKLVIIGRGTAGSIAASQFYKRTDCDVEWHFDSNIKPQAVGEGSTLELPNALRDNLDFRHSHLDAIDGSFKYGIKKSGWGTGTEYIHEFFPPLTSYHFNAIKLQDFVLDKLKDKIKIVEGNATHDQLDCDFIMDCSGRPDSYDDFHMSDYIPVNAVHVTQCYWDTIKFQYTLTLARPYGWVFGIPLQNRCSIGYMYNSNINTLEEVKEDVKNIFKEYNLTPSDHTNTFGFKNYYRKQNFDGRVAYNGNASFFLEPLEATSIALMDYINRRAEEKWFKDKADNRINQYSRYNMQHQYNQAYTKKVEEITNVIMLHYFAGSVYNTEFWKFAQERGQRNMASAIEDPIFSQVVKPDFDGRSARWSNYGTWAPVSWHQNMHNLGLYARFQELMQR